MTNAELIMKLLTLPPDATIATNIELVRIDATSEPLMRYSTQDNVKVLHSTVRNCIIIKTEKVTVDL
jgi:hypothetical protein